MKKRFEQKRVLRAVAQVAVLAGLCAVRAADAVSTPESLVKGDPARVERIKSATMPTITAPIDFYTPAADAVMSALEVFPANNPWNLIVTDWPVHPNSEKIVASIGASKVLRHNDDMAYIIVPPNQPRVAVKLGEYAGESDPGPYPLPDTVPIEGWPADFMKSPELKALSLDDVQRDKLKQDGDRHAIVVDPINRMLYEFYSLRKTDAGWQAAGEATFDLKTNKMRPDGWTSTDAAGLPIFPSIVRYDELKRGVIDHALRVTVLRSRKSYVYPATHHAGHTTDVNFPRMGERLRLKQDFDVSGFSPNVRVLLTAMKRYGMIVADNGISWAVSVAPDTRIPPMHEELRKVKGSDFEVIEAPAGYEPAK